MGAWVTPKSSVKSKKPYELEFQHLKHAEVFGGTFLRLETPQWSNKMHFATVECFPMTLKLAMRALL